MATRGAIRLVDQQAEFDSLMGIVGDPIHIEGNGDLSRVCDEIEYQLVKHKAPIYQRGGMLVRVVREESHQAGVKRDPSAPRIVPFDDQSLVDTITRKLAIYQRNRKTMTMSRVNCPLVIAKTILSRKQWSFPQLEAVVEHPVMLLDGQVLWEAGYHPETGLLLEIPPHTFDLPQTDPSEAELCAALDLMRDLLVGFEFVEDVDLSVALAFLMTAFVRPVLPTCPAFAVDAHAPGSGKSTLVRTQARMATGREPAFLTFRDDPTELQKVLFSMLMEGDQYIAVDNVDMPLSGADLAVILTSPIYKGRVLGQSLTASVPTKAVISFNGNNLQVIGDLTRRVLVMRLDPTCERPAEREFSFNPITSVQEMRGGFVQAALTIMAGYANSGERRPVRPFGSFEEWSRAVREPLVWMGLPDPVDSIRVLEKADPERGQLRAVLAAVSAVHQFNEFKAAALIAQTKVKHAQAKLHAEEDAGETDAQRLSEALHPVCERRGELNAKALGHWLLRVKGRIEHGMRFVQARRTDTGLFWRIESATSPGDQGVKGG